MTAVLAAVDRWELAAACRGARTDAFYAKPMIPTVARYCAVCPVIAQCRADVLAMPVRLRFTGQYRAGHWWPSRDQAADHTHHRDAVNCGDRTTEESR